MFTNKMSGLQVEIVKALVKYKWKYNTNTLR